MIKKNKIKSFILIFGSLLLFSTISSLAIEAQTAFAAEADDSSKNPNDWYPQTRAKRWAYLTGLYNCIDNGDYTSALDDGITAEDGKSGNWFADPFAGSTSNEAASFVGLSPNEDGRTNCNTVVKKVAEVYNVEILTLLCDAGAKRQDGSPCKSSATNSRFDSPKDGKRYDLTSKWGSKDLPQSAGGVAYAVLNYEALMASNGCKLKEVSSKQSGDFAYEVTSVNNTTGELVTKYYTGLKRSHEVAVYTSYPSVNEQRRKCSTIASDASKYAKDYAAWIRDHPDALKDDGTQLDANPDGESEVSCAIDGIGWIICPVMRFMGDLNDKAFGYLNDLLTIRPEVFSSDATRNAWGAFRDLANVAFVIAFLVIIYSQMTGAGINNYGIKKLIPKLIIAAILVNISYFICQLAVDLSNIVGASIYNLLGSGIDIGADPEATSGGNTWNSIVVGALAGGATILLVLVVFLAPSVLLALALVLLILVARQALVILLIVVSPLAFVAYLLPNTEDWFKKWWKAFSVTLMVFPVVGLVFGASTLASDILLEASKGSGGGDDKQLLAIVALAVLGIPLFAVPALIKGSLAAAGSIGAKIGGLQDKAVGRGIKGVKNGRLGEAKTAYDRNRQNSKFKRRAGEGRLAKWGENRGGKLGKTAAWAGTRQRAFDNSTIGRKVGGTRGAAVATQGIHKNFDEDVSAFKSTLSGTSNETILKELDSGKGSDEYKAALAGTIMSRDHRDSHIEALRIVGKQARKAESTGDTSGAESASMVQKQMAQDMKSKPWALGDQATGQLVNGTYGLSQSHTGEAQTQYGNIDEEMKTRVGTKLSTKSLADMNPDEMRAIHEMATGTHKSGVTLDQKEISNLKDKITDLRTSRYKDDIKPEAKQWHDSILTL
jgi:hypothetical protein